LGLNAAWSHLSGVGGDACIGLQGVHTSGIISTFYDYLSLVSLDVDFARPGCQSSDATFFDSVRDNARLLFWAFLPTGCLMPLFVLGFRGMELTCTTPSRIKMFACSRRYWQHRLGFSLVLWIATAAYIITNKAIKVVYCKPSAEPGVWILNADPAQVRTTITSVCKRHCKANASPARIALAVQTCFADAEAWAFFMVGLLAILSFSVVYPVVVCVLIHRLKRDGKLQEELALMSVGYFYSPFKRSRVYWFLVPHYLLGIICRRVCSNFARLQLVFQAGGPSSFE
jgi:hypothetical protein